jgi:xanthine/uracil permease
MKNDSAIHVVFFLLFSIQHTLVQRGAIVVPPLALSGNKKKKKKDIYLSKKDLII